jgi:hypothetical protein
MLRTAEIDMADSVTPNDDDVFLDTFNVFLINYPGLSNAQNTDYETSPSQQKRTLKR